MYSTIIYKVERFCNDTTGTKDFVLYSEVSFAQGLFVDHTPLTVVASYAGPRPWTIKPVVLKTLLIRTV